MYHTYSTYNCTVSIIHTPHVTAQYVSHILYVQLHSKYISIWVLKTKLCIGVSTLTRGKSRPELRTNVLRPYGCSIGKVKL